MNSLNDFIYRGTRPKPMAVPSPKRISTPAGQRLSTILENQNATSPAPQPSNRSESQRFNIGTPPRASEEKRPPSYNSQEGTITDAERAAFAAEPRTLKERLSRRGGWKRLGLIVGGVLLAIIALAVGLGVGLTTSNGNNNNNGKGANGNGNDGYPLGPFPAGAWNFDTYLVDVSTDCTSNPETWTCFPYVNYSESSTGSATTLNWVIKHSSTENNNKFTISSSANPFGPTFHNRPLILRDEDTPNERYTFAIEGTSKTVLPNVSLTDDNNRSMCFFNSTSMTASIYTRKRPTLSASGKQPSNNQLASLYRGQDWRTWEHAVEIDQVSPGGKNSPQCFRISDGHPVGSPISLPSMPVSNECRCAYRNFNS